MVLGAISALARAVPSREGVSGLVPRIQKLAAFSSQPLARISAVFRHRRVAPRSAHEPTRWRSKIDTELKNSPQPWHRQRLPASFTLAPARDGWPWCGTSIQA